MALWGNNDNKGSLGTVSLNYGNKTVTGTGTTFGQTGAAQVGDVIRFGSAFGGTTGLLVMLSSLQLPVLSLLELILPLD